MAAKCKIFMNCSKMSICILQKKMAKQVLLKGSYI